MRIALDSLPTDTTMLQQLVRDMAAALASRDAAAVESQVEIDRLPLIVSERRQHLDLYRRIRLEADSRSICNTGRDWPEAEGPL